MKLFSYMAAVGLCLILQLPILASDPQSLEARQREAPEKLKIVLEGVLVNAKGAPIVARTIHAFPIYRGKIALPMDLSRSARLSVDRTGPNARTDPKGRFRIKYGAPTGIEVAFTGDGYLVQDQYEGFSLAVIKTDGTAVVLRAYEGETAAPSWRKEADTFFVTFGKVVIPDCRPAYGELSC